MMLMNRSPIYAPCSVLKKSEFFRCIIDILRARSQTLCRLPDYAALGIQLGAEAGGSLILVFRLVGIITDSQGR